MDLNIATVPDDTLINLCTQKAEQETLAVGIHDGATLIKLTNTILVKWGWTVTAAEAAIHEFAYNSLSDHRDIVRVPRVYRFIQDDLERGYLFMEYIPGQNLADLDISTSSKYKDAISRVANIVELLGQIQAPPEQQGPGPISHDRGPRGYLWGDDGVQRPFKSTTDLNDWINRRIILRNQNESVDFTLYPLVLCHMDLCRRNMILQEHEDGKSSIYLLDWGHAGFFPRFYELATLSCLNPYDEGYEKPLIGAVEGVMRLTDNEKRDVKMVGYARAASLRWSFPEENVSEEQAFDPASLGTPPPLSIPEG